MWESLERLREAGWATPDYLVAIAGGECCWLGGWGTSAWRNQDCLRPCHSSSTCAAPAAPAQQRPMPPSLICSTPTAPIARTPPPPGGLIPARILRSVLRSENKGCATIKARQCCGGARSCSRSRAPAAGASCAGSTRHRGACPALLHDELHGGHAHISGTPQVIGLELYNDEVDGRPREEGVTRTQVRGRAAAAAAVCPGRGGSWQGTEERCRVLLGAGQRGPPPAPPMLPTLLAPRRLPAQWLEAATPLVGKRILVVDEVRWGAGGRAPAGMVRGGRAARRPAQPCRSERLYAAT